MVFSIKIQIRLASKIHQNYVKTSKYRHAFISEGHNNRPDFSLKYI